MDISLWNKIVIGVRFFFVGFESAVDYVVILLNDFLAQEGIVDRVQKARDFVAKILGYMVKYEKYCPAIWVTHYEKLEIAVKALVDAFEDGKVDRQEIKNTIASVKAAINEWFS